MGKSETKVNISKTGNIDLFGKRLKDARIKAGFSSQKDLAKFVGLDRVTINYYENGTRKPDIQVFIDIADKLNVSYDYLLGYSDTPIREYHDTRELTGLSDKAIEVLHHYVEMAKFKDGYPEWAIDKLKTLNVLIENDEGAKLLSDISEFLWSTYKKSTSADDVIIITDDLGIDRVFSNSDLHNAKLVELQKDLSNFKDTMKIENKGTNGRNEK